MRLKGAAGHENMHAGKGAVTDIRDFSGEDRQHSLHNFRNRDIGQFAGKPEVSVAGTMPRIIRPTREVSV